MVDNRVCVYQMQIFSKYLSNRCIINVACTCRRGGAISALCAAVPHRSPYFFFIRAGLVQLATVTRADTTGINLDIAAIMSEDQVSSSADVARREVRVQLTSKQEDVALPESTGPILVPTGKYTLCCSQQSIE